MARGRPKKYASLAASREARRNRDQQRYLQRQRGEQLQPLPREGPQIIAYEPFLPGDTPQTTPANTGLRISPAAPALSCYDTRGDSSRGEVEELQGAEDKEWSAELVEEDAAITQRVRMLEAKAAEALLDLQRSSRDCSGGGARGLGALPLPRSSYLLQLQAEGAERTGAEAEAETERRAGGAAVTREGGHRGQQGVASPLYTQSPATPTSSRDGGSAHLSSAASSTSKKRKSPFPTQSNNLLNYFQPGPRALPIAHPPAAQPCCLGEQGGPSAASAASTPAPLLASPPPPQVRQQAGPPLGGRSAAAAAEESTASKLAKQLRSFHGCTLGEHSRAQDLHAQHYQRSSAHTECASLQDITQLLQGGCSGAAPLPDVLQDPGFMDARLLREEVDCQAAFEGTVSLPAAALSGGDGAGNRKPPPSLCLSKHYQSSARASAPQTTFDIDSLCCFPTSLGFARQGISWLPSAQPALNLSHDVHFGLQVTAHSRAGELCTVSKPLHRIPHYCFGTAVGMESLLIYVFFPDLHLSSSYEHSTFLSKSDFALWYDGVLMPAIYSAVGSANVLQHYPVSAEVVARNATALSAETFAKKDTSRAQLLRYTLQPQHLHSIWARIQSSVAGNAAYGRFRNATLFANSKDTKLQHMSEDLASAYRNWESCWSRVTNPAFCSKEYTFVDLGKQVTSKDSTLPPSAAATADASSDQAEVFLWKKCCLDKYYQSRVVHLASGKPARGGPSRTVYPFATMRDSANQTILAAANGKERADGLVYSQLYGLIKTPFDTSKAYVFQQDALENLVLDPSYVRSLQQEGGVSTFSEAVCKRAYLHMKQRAHVNLRDNQQRSYGVREEHRISLIMMEEIQSWWVQQDACSSSSAEEPEAGGAEPHLPYYLVPTKELLGFLRAQINKYCLLFEHTRAHTFGPVSHPQSAVMLVALRALRFCYSSSILAREPLLYRDRWERDEQQQKVIVEGFGMQQTIEQFGLGWFLPKFNWTTLRIRAPHGENMLRGCLLNHPEYKRRWQAVKDLQNVFVRFNQAERWFYQYKIGENPGLLRRWLEYLYALNIEQFDVDVWRAMRRADKKQPQLSPRALQQGSKIAYCYDGMKDLFLADNIAGPPHIVTGNKGAFKGVGDLIDFLFLQDDRKRTGWGWKPFRQVLQRTHGLLERELGYRRAELWLDQFLHLVRLTHWVLPSPSDRALIESTKTNQAQGLSRRLMWFSAVFAHPELTVQHTGEDNPRTLHVLLYKAHRSARRGGSLDAPWDAFELSRACGRQGIKILGVDEDTEHWHRGRRSIGSQGWLPTWEQGRPPLLAMQGRVRGMGLDELEAMMADFAAQEGQGDHQQQQEVAGGSGAPSLPSGEGSMGADTSAGSVYAPSE